MSICCFSVSADMAHGLHPNFPDKYEEHHRPALQKGVVIKHNANQRYATSSLTAFLFKEVANVHNLPVQVLPMNYMIFWITFSNKISFFKVFFLAMHSLKTRQCITCYPLFLVRGDE